MTLAYCTANDIYNRLSQDGVTYRTDDIPPTTLGDVIGDASAIIDEHCYFLYDPVNLQGVDWVRHRTADIATFLLCERRGNPVPQSIARKYEYAMDRLQKIQLGIRQIPGVPVRKSAAPVMSNVRVRLDPFPRVVVERSNSTGTPENYSQNTDRLDFNFDYSI